MGQRRAIEPIQSGLFVPGRMKRLSAVLDDCQSIAASTDEIIWSDDDTIVADMEDVWNQGTILRVTAPLSQATRLPPLPRGTFAPVSASIPITYFD